MRAGRSATGILGAEDLIVGAVEGRVDSPSLMLTTEAVVAEIPEADKGGAAGMGGRGSCPSGADIGWGPLSRAAPFAPLRLTRPPARR